MNRLLKILVAILCLVCCTTQALPLYAKIKPSYNKEVKTFVDVVKHLSKTKYRCKLVFYSDNRDKFEKSEVLQRNDYYMTLARKIDSLNIVDFRCDTLSIYSSGSDWNVGVRYPEIIKCRKGFFLYKNNKLEPTTVPEDPYYNMIEKVDGKDVNIQPVPLPGTLQWFMLISNCFDDQEMIRLFPAIHDVRSLLIRIVIHNNRVVYCDRYSE